jgi:hypothetical protein
MAHPHSLVSLMMASQASNSIHHRLLFVYNADAGFLSMLKDWTHKMVSPSTYNCQLCLLTYGHTGMRKQWQAFIHQLPFDPCFLHRDEFHVRYPQGKGIELPCILLEHNTTGKLDILIDADTMNQQQTLDELIDTSRTRILANRQSPINMS